MSYRFMRRVPRLVGGVSLVLMGAGCATTGDNPPLIFGQTQVVGLSIGGTAADQGAELVLGYKDGNIAIVPVTAKQPQGNTQLIAKVQGDDNWDAFSVLGQFELGADAQADVSLGKFFAVGFAARYLAQGFQAEISGTQVSASASTEVSAAPAGGATATAGGE